MLHRSLAAAAAMLLASTAGVVAAQEGNDRDVVVTGTRGGSGWQEATSKHFVVYSYDTPQHVGQYAAKLERFDKAIRVLHGTPEDRRGAASRVTVYVVGSLADVKKLARNDRVAGYYQPRTKAQAFMPRSTGEASDYGMTPQTILFHEYTHHWMLTTWTDAAFPAWYTEGAAELHATALMRPDGSVTFGAIPTYRRNSISANVLPASTLLRGRVDKLDDRQAGTLYGRGWLLTHYLTFDNDRRGQLAAYIGAINSGKSVDDAAQVFGNVSGLDGKLDAYGKRSALPALTMPAADLKIEQVKVRSLSPAEAAMMPALLRSKNGVDKTLAPQVVTMAREAAAPYPNDPAAQNELAEAEYDAASLGPAADATAGYARAEAAADRALAADPKSIHALLYKGMAEQAVAVAAKKTDTATWAGVRRWYLAANKADTEDPEPLIAYYESFAAAKQTPTKGAQEGILYAYALAPHDPSARMLAAGVLLQRGNTKAARAAIAPVAYRADIGASGAKLRKVLDAIDAGDSKAALAELEKKDDGNDKSKV